MKTKLLFIISVLLISFEITARDADAVFKTNNGAPMVVFIDGNRINQQPTDVIKLNKLYAGKHQVRIKVFGKRFNREINRPIHLKRHHKTKFVVNSVGRRGNLQLVKVNEKRKYANTYQRNPKPSHNYNHGGQCYVGQTVNMDRLMISLNYKRFDSEKEDFLEIALANKSLYTHDLIEILSQLTFESTKLDVAILAHPGIVDKENFHLVYDAFKFRSSIRKLEKYSYDDSWF